MFHYSLRVIDEPKMSEIRILNLCHKKSILVDIYRQLLLNILRTLHNYVPYGGDGDDWQYGEQGIVGDQLSIERAVNGHISLANGFTPEDRLEGLHFEVADWHAGNKFLEVSIQFGFQINLKSAF